MRMSMNQPAKATKTIAIQRSSDRRRRRPDHRDAYT
jgi:hypothetical protein